MLIQTKAIIVWILLGWLFTTFSMASALWTEFRQLRDDWIRGYLASPWNVLDLLRIIPMLGANGILLATFCGAPKYTSSRDTAVALYAISILFFAFRAISYCRGYLVFATLVYSIGVIITQVEFYQEISYTFYLTAFDRT